MTAANVFGFQAYRPEEAILFKSIVFGCALSLVLTSTVFAQSGNVPDQAQLIENLMTRIDQLERRVAEVEGARAHGTAAALVPAAAEAMQMGTQADTTDSRPSLHVAGFTDINFAASDQPGVHSGFTEGQVI